MSNLPLFDYESLLDEKRCSERSVKGQLLALAVVFAALLFL